MSIGQVVSAHRLERRTTARPIFGESQLKIKGKGRVRLNGAREKIERGDLSKTASFVVLGIL